MARKTKARVKNRQEKASVDLEDVERCLGQALDQLGCGDADLSLMLVDDAAIRVLNKRYLGKDRATNVLAFSMREADAGGVDLHLLGDIVVSVETAQRDAREGGMALEDMIVYLAIHGLLHLLGYDHEGSTDERLRMFRREQELFFAVKQYWIEAE